MKRELFMKAVAGHAKYTKEVRYYKNTQRSFNQSARDGV